MQFHLYRPIVTVRGGVAVCIDQTTDLSDYEMARLVRLKRATFIPSPPCSIGAFMSDDCSSSLRLVAPPAIEPLTLAQAKTFLRVEHNADDEPITRAISAARLAAENYLKIALLPQTWDFTRANPTATKLNLPFGPAQSISSITLTNEVGATTTMNAGNYRMSVDGFAVMFEPAVSIEKLTVRYVAGIGAVAADIPSMMIQGMLHHIAVLMEQRDGNAPMPAQSLSCYQPYRRISL